jgi:MarR family transcriptional regulator, organic hydroperoxide resistance regulator
MRRRRMNGDDERAGRAGLIGRVTIASTPRMGHRPPRPTLGTVTTEKREHEELVRALVDRVRDIAVASEQIGTTFASHQDLHSTDFRALTLIYQAENSGKPLSPTRLAEALGLSHGAVTYVVDRLTASGHVWRGADPTDKRRVVLRIAGHGREVAANFFGPLGRAHSHTLAAFTADELAIALRVLSDVSTALSEFQNDL